MVPRISTVFCVTYIHQLAHSGGFDSVEWASVVRMALDAATGVLHLHHEQVVYLLFLLLLLPSLPLLYSPPLLYCPPFSSILLHSPPFSSILLHSPPFSSIL